jgi:hypothetical protein
MSSRHWCQRRRVFQRSASVHDSSMDAGRLRLRLPSDPGLRILTRYERDP